MNADKAGFDSDRDNALSVLADLVDEFGYAGIEEMLATLKRNDLTQTDR